MRLTVPSSAPILVGALALAVLSVLPTDAHAIPAFARKYKVSCMLCHQPVPRLNKFGETFAKNGFEFMVGEPPRDTVATGDPLLRLQGTLPLAVRVDAYQQLLSKRAAGEVAFDQQLPWIVKVMSGGQVADRISYYVYFLATERGEVAGLEDAYLQFTDIARTGINLVAGQFQISDPLFKRELRLEYEDYQPYRVRVGDTRADLTYDRGLMATWSPRNGTDVAVQVLNGRGLDQASPARQYDGDSYKTYALRLSQEIGAFRLGVFGYTGQEGANGVSSQIQVLGPDLTVELGSKGQLNVQYLRRWDSDPFLGRCSPATPCPGGSTAPFATTVDAAMAEVIVWPTGPAGRWFFTGIINDIRADEPVVSLRLGEQDGTPGFLTKYRTGSLGAHYLLRRNVRLMTEGTWDIEREQARVVTGFTVAF